MRPPRNPASHAQPLPSCPPGIAPLTRENIPAPSQLHPNRTCECKDGRVGAAAAQVAGHVAAAREAEHGARAQRVCRHGRGGAQLLRHARVLAVADGRQRDLAVLLLAVCGLGDGWAACALVRLVCVWVVVVGWAGGPGRVCVLTEKGHCQASRASKAWLPTVQPAPRWGSAHHLPVTQAAFGLSPATP